MKIFVCRKRQTYSPASTFENVLVLLCPKRKLIDQIDSKRFDLTQIANFTRFPSTSICFTEKTKKKKKTSIFEVKRIRKPLKSTPIVAAISSSKRSSVKRSKRQLFPTPDSPIIKIFNVAKIVSSRNGIFKKKFFRKQKKRKLNEKKQVELSHLDTCTKTIQKVPHLMFHKAKTNRSEEKFFY